MESSLQLIVMPEGKQIVLILYSGSVSFWPSDVLQIRITAVRNVLQNQFI